MACLLLIFSQSDYLICIVSTNSRTGWQTVQVQIIWLSQLIWIYIVCKGRVYLGSAGQGLKGLNIHGRLLPGETTLVTSCLLYCLSIPYWKAVYSIRKEFAPFGSKLFPYRVDPFSEGYKIILTDLFCLKLYQFFRCKISDYICRLLCFLLNRLLLIWLENSL